MCWDLVQEVDGVEVEQLLATLAPIIKGITLASGSAVIVACAGCPNPPKMNSSAVGSRVFSAAQS